MKRAFMAALGAMAVAMTAALAPQAGALLPYAPLSPDRRQHSRFDGRGSGHTHGPVASLRRAADNGRIQCHAQHPADVRDR